MGVVGYGQPPLFSKIMSNPTYYSEGTTPRLKDTKYKVWTKILGAIQNNVAANPAYNPRKSDTLRQVKQKINKAIRAI